MNGGWLMMKMSLLNLIRGVLKLVVWNVRIIWAWLCYLLLLVLVDERWLSCFDLVNLKAHTRSLVNERYISVKGLRWWDVVAIFVVLSLRWVSEMLQSCGEHHVFFLVMAFHSLLVLVFFCSNWLLNVWDLLFVESNIPCIIL